MTDQEKVRHAAYRLLTDPELEPLVQWWTLGLENAALPPGPVDPYRLAMAQGDRERLVHIKALAAHAKTEKDRAHAPVSLADAPHARSRGSRKRNDRGNAPG